MRCSLAASKSSTAPRSPLRYIKTASISTGLDAGPAEAQPNPRTPRQGAGPIDPRFGLLVDGEYYGPFA